MKNFVVYKDVPVLTGEPKRLYLQDYGLYTDEKDNAKKFQASTILQILIIVLQLILKLKSKHKYELT